jgi:hypothetical protein
MVAGILEKSKRLRKAFFFIQETPKVSAAVDCAKETAECWSALRAPGNYRSMNLERQ